MSCFSERANLSNFQTTTISTDPRRQAFNSSLRAGRFELAPVGDGLIGNQFWLVAEHGMKAGYVRNIERDPHVRVKLREGLRYRWHTGTAHLLSNDDPRERHNITTDSPARMADIMDRANSIVETEPRALACVVASQSSFLSFRATHIRARAVQPQARA
jgi:hypothetical protein